MSWNVPSPDWGIQYFVSILVPYTLRIGYLASPVMSAVLFCMRTQYVGGPQMRKSTTVCSSVRVILVILMLSLAFCWGFSMTPRGALSVVEWWYEFHPPKRTSFLWLIYMVSCVRTGSPLRLAGVHLGAAAHSLSIGSIGIYSGATILPFNTRSKPDNRCTEPSFSMTNWAG